MRYQAKKNLNLGGGHFLTEGQTVDMPAGTRIQGLEPVLERGPEAPTLERVEAGRNLDAPGRLRVLNG
jgi:hypothetical protein